MAASTALLATCAAEEEVPHPVGVGVGARVEHLEHDHPMKREANWCTHPEQENALGLEEGSTEHRLRGRRQFYRQL